jgi:hypothetical protein
MYTRVDQALIADVLAQESVQVNGLTQPEFITAAGPFVDWLAIGTVVTGATAVVGAAVFVVGRRRTRRRVAREGGTTATFWGCTVYGAVVTALVSFIPGSAIGGGAAAAYLHDGNSSVRIGTAAGLIGTALTIPLVAFLAVGIVAGSGAIGELAGGTLLAVIIIGGELVALAINAGLGALGGFAAAKFV